MPPHSRDDFDIVEEQAPQGDNLHQETDPHQSQDEQQEQEQEEQADRFGIDFEAYYGANHCPPSARPSSSKFDMFKSRREMRHRRTTSRDRSLWHRASRRILSAEAAELSPQEENISSFRAEPSRKHNSLTASAPMFWHQQQAPQRRHQTWYYSSNHVLVNRERLTHGLRPMTRSVALDEKARQVAEWAAQGKDLKDMVQEGDAQKFISGNVLVGGSIREIHGQTLIRETCKRERNNMLNPEYREFGMGTYKDPESGLLYMCQLFGNGGMTV